MKCSPPPPGGSSPRVRGTRRHRLDFAAADRFIPAGAGNACLHSTTTARSTVHPRGCGERVLKNYSAILAGGSSPRVRGTLRALEGIRADGRFIPAGAGNASDYAGGRARKPVHPRGCGERFISRILSTLACGSSPRVRGTRATQRAGRRHGRFHPRGCGERPAYGLSRYALHGSSPRVRGTRHMPEIDVSRERFIPAGAGNAETTGLPDWHVPVHPRGCGERGNRTATGSDFLGSSPRVRGTPTPEGQQAMVGRFIPAGAGNAAGRCSRTRSSSVHPRGCGERATRVSTWVTAAGSSPRVRGTRRSLTAGLVSDRFIPAGAGNATTTNTTAITAAVHPRGCEERFVRDAMSSASTGSSPRVRGTQCRGRQIPRRQRFIPAGAGNAS